MNWLVLLLLLLASPVWAADVRPSLTGGAAATAAALAANPADCGTTQIAIGITADGTAVCVEMQVFDLARYGVVVGGTTADTVANTTAIHAACAVANAAGGGVILFPGPTLAGTGDFIRHRAITCNVNRVSFVGAGGFATRLKFEPPAASTGDDLVGFNIGDGVTEINQIRIANLVFYTTDTTQTKVGLRLRDVRSIYIENVRFGSGGSDWTGANSIGLKYEGREFFWATKLDIYADRPMVLGHGTTLRGADHFTCHLCNLIVPILGGVNPVIEVLANTVLSNVTFSNNSWNRGVTGFKWVSTTVNTPSIGINVSFENIRYEQQEDVTNNWGLNIDVSGAGSPLDNLKVSNFYFGNNAKGIKLRGVRNVLISNLKQPPGETPTSLDIDSTVTGGVVMVACDVDGAVTSSGQSLVINSGKALKVYLATSGLTLPSIQATVGNVTPAAATFTTAVATVEFNSGVFRAGAGGAPTAGAGQIAIHQPTTTVGEVLVYGPSAGAANRGVFRITLLDSAAGNSVVPFTLNANETVTFTGAVTAPSFVGALTGNASTATALAADPTDCSTGTVALGINAAGTGQCTATPSVTSIQGILGNVTPAAITGTTVTATGQTTVAAGSAAAPSIKFTGTTDGFYSLGATTVGVSIGGTNVAYFDANHIYLIGSDQSLYWNTDGAGTIGQANANRPNHVYAKTTINVANSAFVANATSTALSGSAASNGSIRISATNTSSGGYADTFMFNSDGKYAGLQIAGSTVSSTYAGITNANISKLLTSADNFLIGTDGSAPTYWITNATVRGSVAAAGGINLGATAATLTAGAVGFTKITASASAPGAGTCKLEWVAGTNAGTCKQVSYCGTSTTATTIIDNVGGSC